MTPVSTEIDHNEVDAQTPPPAGAPQADDAPETQTPPAVEAADAEEGAPAADAGAEVYDSEARQRIPVTLLLDDGRYDVALVCEPASDAVLLRYASLCEAAAAAETANDDEEEEAGTRLFTGLSRAVNWLFKTLMSDVEGVGDEGEPKPADWREIFGAREREEIIDRAVFGAEFVEPPAPKKGARPK